MVQLCMGWKVQKRRWHELVDEISCVGEVALARDRHIARSCVGEVALARVRHIARSCLGEVTLARDWDMAWSCVGEVALARDRDITRGRSQSRSNMLAGC